MSLPIRIGVAFAVTVAIGYATCTLIFWLWPEAAVTFMNALFHGLDFRKLQAGGTLFSFQSFVYALIVMAAWAFAMGGVFGFIWTRFFASNEG
jgi:hypothetical protein